MAEGACMAGVGGVHGRRDGHCSGRYASYWNAFLLNDAETVVLMVRIQSLIAYSHILSM